MKDFPLRRSILTGRLHGENMSAYCCEISPKANKSGVPIKEHEGEKIMLEIIGAGHAY